MKAKNFSLSTGLISLCIAGMMAVLTLPMAAHAADPTIEWIRIYLNPTFHTTSGLSYTQYPGPYIHTDSNGAPIGATEVTQATQAAGTGDVIVIAIRLHNVNWVDAYLELLSGWDTAATGSTIKMNRLRINRTLEKAAGEALDLDQEQSFTAVYHYTVQEGDSDTDGGWFPNNSPFGLESVSSGTRGYSTRWNSLETYDDLEDFTYSGNIVYPKIETVAPKMAPVDTHPVRFTDSRGTPIDWAPHVGRSRYHEIRQDCLEHHGKYHTAYTDACVRVAADGWSHPERTASREVGYYGLGDTLYLSIRFTEPVTVEPDNAPTLRQFAGSSYQPTYHTGSGTDTLVFKYEVQAEDTQFGEIRIGSALRHNYDDPDSGGNVIPLDDPRAKWIRDLAGNRLVERWPDTAGALFAYFRSSDPTNFLIDSRPASVWIPGLIKNGETHRNDKRIAGVNLDTSWTEMPLTDVSLDITEGTPQRTAFDVEFRFFNPNDADALADEVGESFTSDDVQITGTNVARDEWGVAVTYIGLDHRATNSWPPPNHSSGREPGSDHQPGHAKNSAAFLVYKATITPPLGFQGKVAISLPAGATQDIAGNASLASNTLTVPVNIPFQVVEAPEIVEPPAGAYTVGDKIEIEVTYNRQGLRYIGEEPPYLTLYLGEQVQANARHATWQEAEDANSTKVTFAYEVAATDVANVVSLAPIGLTVPSRTRLVDAEGSQLLGTSKEVAKGSGEAPAQAPAQGQLPLVDTSGRRLPTVMRDTPVVTYVPILEPIEEPRSPASDVPRSPIVFNELGNGSGDANDWLEFRNVTGSAVSLKEWELSVVQDGKKEDTSLIVFPDVSVPANALLLITHSDPTAAGNVLAGGDDVSTADVEQKGSPHRYLVAEGLSLPDDGKFLLILRKAKEKLGLDEAFVDVAGGGGSGTDAFVREQTGLYETYVWPLQVLEAPGSATEDALSSGKVWQRVKADIVGYHKDAWAEAAFTGLGYDRKVSASAATAGTPGYPNVAAKEAAAKGSVTFSEIMVDSDGGKLPQWIELYNNSKTEVLNLNRWELEIQNVDSEDLVGRPIVTLTLQEKVIQPHQTLLIVTGDARASSADVFPEDRVYNLLELHDKNLRIKKPQDTFLSAEGFYLKLTDRNGQLVDEVGNTDGDRRTKDAPAWALRRSDVEGSRSSLVRRYETGGIAEEGTQAASWVLAANVAKIAASELHYGHADDIGTPGHRRGGALPVELSSFSVKRNESGAVVVTWATESEVDNAGFNLRRSLTRDSGFTLLNPALIAGAGTTGERQTYTFTDTSAKPGVAYYYQIEEVAFDGKRETLAMRRLRGPVSAANRALTTFGAVKQREK